MMHKSLSPRFNELQKESMALDISPPGIEPDTFSSNCYAVGVVSGVAGFWCTYGASLGGFCRSSPPSQIGVPPKVKEKWRGGDSNIDV